MKAILTFGAAAAFLLAAGCDKSLTVEDLSDPDIARVFATGASIEATIGAGFQTVHNAMSNTNDQPGVEAFGLESYSSLNNFNLGTRSAIPRLPINNVVGAPSIFSEYTALAKEARLIVNAMDALDALIKSGKTIGTPARDLRARSFGFFVAGISEGWLALMYDSAAIVTPRHGSAGDSSAEPAHRTSRRRPSCCSIARSRSRTIRLRPRVSPSKRHGSAARRASVRSIRTSD